MATRTLPTIEHLRQCLAYDPGTGVLAWKPRPRDHFISDQSWHRWLTRYAGKLAGCPAPSGYICVTIDRQHYDAHRLIWKIMTGTNPIAEIDHINRIALDNSWTNLREATSQQNKYNKRVLGAVAMKGVHRRPSGNYAAQARDANGKRVHLGTFATAEEAHNAFTSFVQPLRGNFYHPT